MKLLIFPALIMTACVSETKAQTTPGISRESTFTVGSSYKRVTDAFILSYPVTGSTINAGYHFIKASDPKKSSILLEGSTGSLSNQLVDIKNQSFTLQFSQGFSLFKSRDGRLNSYWGYSIETNPSFVKARNKEESRQSWATFNDLSLYQSLVYKYGRNKITWDITLPLVGLASRPLEKNSWHNTMNGMMYDSYSNLFVTSWQNRQAVSSSVEIKRALAGNVNILLGARFKYNTVSKDYYYKEIRAGVYGGISLSIK